MSRRSWTTDGWQIGTDRRWQRRSGQILVRDGHMRGVTHHDLTLGAIRSGAGAARTEEPGGVGYLGSRLASCVGFVFDRSTFAMLDAGSHVKRAMEVDLAYAWSTLDSRSRDRDARDLG